MDFLDDTDGLMAEAVWIVALAASVELLKVVLLPDSAAFQADAGIFVANDDVAALDLGIWLLDKLKLLWFGYGQDNVGLG